MHIKAIKTKLFKPPKDDLYREILAKIKRIPERSVLAIASKVLSIHQGRCIPISKVKDKDRLVKKEADRYLPRNRVPGGYAVLTVKNHILIPSAGIDESNAGKYYILWPEKIKKAAQEIYRFISKNYKTRNFGVIITDSHTVPLRRGVMGIALSYAGFEPLNDYRGRKDLFGRKFKVSTSNVADSLAVAAVLEMGEGRERKPLALITDIPYIQFISKPYLSKGKKMELKIPWREDLYRPLLRAIRWKE